MCGIGGESEGFGHAETRRSLVRAEDAEETEGAEEGERAERLKEVGHAETGMVRDRAAGCLRRFAGEWQAISRPAEPAGGTTIDPEARAAIVAILTALEAFGIFSGT